MPVLFCLALQPALQEIQYELSDGDYIFAYLDNIYIIFLLRILSQYFPRLKILLNIFAILISISGNWRHGAMALILCQKIVKNSEWIIRKFFKFAPTRIEDY